MLAFYYLRSLKKGIVMNVIAQAQTAKETNERGPDKQLEKQTKKEQNLYTPPSGDGTPQQHQQRPWVRYIHRNEEERFG